MMPSPTRLAACALLASLAASASGQSTPPSSSVTVYGAVDLSVARLSNGSSPLYMPPPVENGKHGQRLVKAGGPSFVGLRGLEDLGGGLYAGFDIQHRFFADTGTLENPNVFWHGKTVLYLRHAQWGDLYFGRDNVLAFYNAIPADPFAFDYSVAALGPDFTLARYAIAGEGGFRTSNQVGFRSARFSGFAFAAAVAAGEGTGTGRKRNDSLSLSYLAGPAYVGLGWDRGGTAAGDRQLVNLAAAYDFGPLKLSGSLARKTDDAGTVAATRAVSSQTLGLSVPVGMGAAKLALGRINPDGDANNTVKWGVGYEHFLSKRTSLKASFASSKTEALSRTTGYEAGMSHRF